MSAKNSLGTAVATRLCRRFLQAGDRVVCVKSWRPSIGEYGPEWPCLLVDSGGERKSLWPIWRFARVPQPGSAVK
jgi:hypothetical protein